MNKDVKIEIFLIFFVLFVSACANKPTAEIIKNTTQSQQQTFSCKGSADCYYGTITRVVDGDTLEVDGASVRLTLVDAPEIRDVGGLEAKAFAETICPLGAPALVDEDDGQTEGSYGRLIGVVYCNGKNLNEEMITNGYASVYLEFCDVSEFANELWALQNGC